MTTFRHYILKIAAPTYALMVAALILLLSGSPYEFMIGEVDHGKITTLCDLPQSVDTAREIYVPMTGAFILVLLIIGAVSSARSRRPKFSLLLGCIVLTLWIYRFFLRFSGC